MPTLIFCDSWDHYDTINTKWDSAGSDTEIDMSGTLSRTGIGCLRIRSAAFGPIKTFSQITKCVVGTAFSEPQPADPVNEIIRYMYAPTQAQNVRISVQPDGAMQAFVGNRGGIAITLLGTTAAGVFQFDTYNYIECAVFCAAAPNGSVLLKVNGVEVLNITGVKTYAEPVDQGQPFISQIQLMAAGGQGNGKHDDTYIADWSSTPSAPFYGPIRLYVVLPTADKTPLQWTPSTGVTHFSLVDEVPPNEDTDYVSSNTVGQIDQYEYTSNTLPAGASVSFVQHTMDAELDAAGSRSIASVAGDVLSGLNFPLTSSYVMYTTPYDENPVSTNPWLLADFPFDFGPQVTA